MARPHRVSDITASPRVETVGVPADWQTAASRIEKAAAKKPQGVLSMIEVGEVLGTGADKTRQIVGRLIKDGKAVVEWVQVQNIVGRTVRVPAYKIVP